MSQTMSDNLTNPPTVIHGPAAEPDEFGSLEGAVAGDSIPEAALAGLVPVDAPAPAVVPAPVEQAPEPAEALPPFERVGFWFPGPMPMLAAKPIKGSLGIPVVLLPDAEARVAMFSDLNAQLAKQLQETVDEAGQLYATARRAEAALEVAVNMIERMHAVVARAEEANEACDGDTEEIYDVPFFSSVDAYIELKDILAEDKPE